MEELLARFKQATDVLETHAIDYVVFGGIAVWAYGRRRDTRDIDLLIRPADAKHCLNVLAQAGFTTEETDDRWLYKAAFDHTHIDLIFEARGQVKLTPEILKRQRRIDIDGLPFKVMDPENLVMMKILATKEIRPADWYDGLSILENSESFDWDYFMGLAGRYVTNFLSFLFFAESIHQENTGEPLVPHRPIRTLFDLYQRDHANSNIL